MTKDYYGTKRVTANPAERKGEKGYAVQYEGGYTSWSPQDVFDAAYQPVDAMGFSGALQAFKDGHKIGRRDIVLDPADGTSFDTGQFSTGWLQLSPLDIWADDWTIID